jgi:hypothetical protein
VQATKRKLPAGTLRFSPGNPTKSSSFGGKQFWYPEEVPVIWEGSIAGGGGGEGGISYPRLCAGAGDRSRGPGKDSLQYFPTKKHPTFVNFSLKN